MNQIIDRADVQTLLSLIPNGAFFTVVFTKKPAKGETVGAERVMNCRRGVTKHLTLNPTKAAPAVAPNFVRVYDVKEAGYQMFNLLTLKTLKIIKAQGFTYEVA